MEAFQIIKGYIPGCIGRIVEMHGVYYHEHWGFGPFFEAKVAQGLGEFMTRYNSDQDGLWLVITDQGIQGSIVIDGIHAEQDGAHLRWFISSDVFRGKGAGNQLIRNAIDFCSSRQYSQVYLDTFKGLEAARHLYEKAGFSLIEEQPGTKWGTEVIEQRYVLSIDT